MRRVIFLVFALLLCAGVGGFLWWRNAAGVSTDDAFVRADLVQVGAEVSGRIVEVLVKENQHVSAGDVLYRIDPKDIELEVAQAEAMLAAAVADAKRAEESAAATRSDLSVGKVRLDDAQRELDRQQQLVTGGATVQAAVDRAGTSRDVARQSLRSAQVGLSAAMAAVEAARARVPAAEAALALAHQKLENCEVRAPASGVASKADLQVGELVNRGQAMLAIVPDERYVVANFKETSLSEIHPGDAVEIDVDALSGHPLEGRVESIGAGTGAVFSLLPADNASGNFVKVVQRVPVRIAFLTPPSEPMPAGLSATVTVRRVARVSEATAEVAPTGAAQEPAVNPWAVTGVVMLGMMMSIIDASIVNVSVPHMMGTFGSSVSEISWVVTAYTLANVILIPLSAWLGSVVGRSRMYGVAISVFTVASVLCGLAPTLPALIAARVAQGAAAGILMPTGQAILYESFPPEKRGSSMAVFGLGVMVGPAVGPTLGGWITDNYGWPWIFFINLPIGMIGAALVPMFLRDPSYLRRRTSAGGDLVGIALLATGIATVQYVLEYGEDAGWFGADWIVIATTFAVVVLAGFVVWELDHPDPAVDLRVFADPSFRAAALVNVAIGVGLMGGMFMLPLFLQQLIGFSATQSGLVLVPGALATAVAMPICGRLSDRSDPRILSGFGLIVFAASMVMMSRLDSRAGQADLLLPQILRGIGMGFCFVPLSVAAMARIPRERMGQATGLFNLTRQVGGSLGVAWLASLVGRFREAHQANLVGYVTPYSDNVRDTMRTVSSALIARGVSVDPSGLAGYVLYGRVMKASAELAFRDMFLVIVALFVASLPLLLFLQRREAGTGPAPAVAHAE